MSFAGCAPAVVCVRLARENSDAMRGLFLFVVVARIALDGRRGAGDRYEIRTYCASLVRSRAPAGGLL